MQPNIPDHPRLLAAVQQAQPSTVGAVHPGALVKVSGRAEPGPAGLLTAPFSGQPCVWFRAVMVPIGQGLMYSPPIQPELPLAFTSDMPAPQADPGRAPGDRVSAEAFHLADGTGRILLDLRSADVDSGIVSVNSRTEHRGDQPHAYWREWIIPPGSPVFACGTAAAGPTLAGSPLVVSTKGEGHVVARAQASMARRPGSAGVPNPAVLVGTIVGAVALLVVVIVLIVVLGG